MLRAIMVIMFVFLLLAGCGSRMVIPAGGSAPTAYGPLNETVRPGMVSYLNAGALHLREARRRHAYQQMYTQCQGRYAILAEGTNNDGGSSIHWGYGIVTHHVNQHVYIQFVCRPEGTHAPAVATSPETPGGGPGLSQERQTAGTGQEHTIEQPSAFILRMDAQLYPMPSFQARPTTNRVRTGEAVQVLTQQDQWMYVETTAGERGWVHRGWFQE